MSAVEAVEKVGGITADHDGIQSRSGDGSGGVPVDRSWWCCDGMSCRCSGWRWRIGGCEL